MNVKAKTINKQYENNKNNGNNRKNENFEIVLMCIKELTEVSLGNTGYRELPADKITIILSV